MSIKNDYSRHGLLTRKGMTLAYPFSCCLWWGNPVLDNIHKNVKEHRFGVIRLWDIKERRFKRPCRDWSHFPVETQKEFVRRNPVVFIYVSIWASERERERQVWIFQPLDLLSKNPQRPWTWGWGSKVNMQSGSPMSVTTDSKGLYVHKSMGWWTHWCILEEKAYWKN